jgi:hypothetical protein
MVSTSSPDLLLQQLCAIEQSIQTIEQAQRNATLTVTRQLHGSGRGSAGVP